MAGNESKEQDRGTIEYNACGGRESFGISKRRTFSNTDERIDCQIDASLTDFCKRKCPSGEGRLAQLSSQNVLQRCETLVGQRRPWGKALEW